jgi:hypothetical protein
LTIDVLSLTTGIDRPTYNIVPCFACGATFIYTGRPADQMAVMKRKAAASARGGQGKSTHQWSGHERLAADVEDSTIEPTFVRLLRPTRPR